MKCRFDVLRGDIRQRVREIIRQVCAENGVSIIRGVLSKDHVHMFVSVPPILAISDLVRKVKGGSPHKIQRELPALKNATGDATSGAITEDFVLQYLVNHIPHTTGASR